ncbi:LicD family protein [Microlunatus endophyticus]
MPSPVAEIRLSLPGTAEQLDLRGLELLRERRLVRVDEGRTRISQSSGGRSHGVQRSPLAFGGIRTERESSPWWAMAFDPPIDIDEVRLYNRLDGWGVRADHLAVAFSEPGGELQDLVSVDSDLIIDSTLALLRRLTGLDLPVEILATKGSADQARREVLGSLAGLASRARLAKSREEQRLLASLLPRRPMAGQKNLTDDEWALLGHLLACERLRVPSSKTSVVSFHRVLDTRDKLSRLETEVNRAATVLRCEPVLLTRHGFSEVSALRRRSGEFLDLIERAGNVLAECGYPAMLAYGTLLGAVREGDFLAHDDDVDMLIPIPAATRDDVEKALAPLADQLRARGWRVSRPNSYTNFHLTDPGTRLHVDVFPLLVDGSSASLHMEEMRLRPIPTRIVLPPKPFTFLGRDVLVPADPEAFLEERYGAGWSTPDPFYDWPWKLQD